MFLASISECWKLAVESNRVVVIWTTINSARRGCPSTSLFYHSKLVPNCPSITFKEKPKTKSKKQKYICNCIINIQQSSPTSLPLSLLKAIIISLKKNQSFHKGHLSFPQFTGKCYLFLRSLTISLSS